MTESVFSEGKKEELETIKETPSVQSIIKNNN